MGNGSEMPTINFLMQPENLPEVLRIVQHTEQIREVVEDRFWTAFQVELKRRKPTGIYNFAWKRTTYCDQKRAGTYDYSLPPIWFGLDAILPNSGDERRQGLKYRIEIAGNKLDDAWVCVGFMWMVPEKPREMVDQYCKIQALKSLQQRLNSEYGADADTDSANAAWFWTCTLERKPFLDTSEAWPWLHSKDEPWYSQKADSFWKLVDQTYEMVVKANEELRQFKG